MDYMIKIQLFNLGHDEAEETVEEIGALLAGRDLGVSHEDAIVRAIVGLFPQETEPDPDPEISDEELVYRWMERFTDGATYICLPKAGHITFYDD